MKNVSTARALRIACALSATFGLSACSSADLASTAEVKPVSLSFTASANSQAADPNAAGLPPTIGVMPSISKVEMVITRLALRRTDDGDCASELENASCVFVTREPELIDMPVDGTLRTRATTALTAGTYSKVEAGIGVVTSATAGGTAFLRSHPDFAGNSLRVMGVFNGVPFTFNMALNANIEMKFSPVLVINGTSKNTTVAVDVSRWFVSMHGYVMDPSKATPGTPVAAIIESNIRASFRAFEDNQRRGN